MHYPVTPDGRYFVVRGRLWRSSNPNLSGQERAELVSKLMQARRDLRRSNSITDARLKADTRQRLHEIKVALGERGPVWWTDGAPDYNRHLVRNTPYRDWFESLPKKG